MFLNAEIPHVYCLLRREYLYDLRDHHGEFERCAVFGVTSIPPRALMFTCMLANGAQIARLPVSAFVHREDAESLPLDWLQLWGSFSYEISVTQYGYLKDMRCAVLLKDKAWREGKYLMTFDWCQSAYAEEPGEGGFKTAHLVQLDNGCFALQPNNRMRWWEPSFITEPFPERPDYLTNSHVWLCEFKEKWATENTDRMFYEVATRIR